MRTVAKTSYWTPSKLLIHLQADRRQRRSAEARKRQSASHAPLRVLPAISERSVRQ